MPLARDISINWEEPHVKLDDIVVPSSVYSPPPAVLALVTPDWFLGTTPGRVLEARVTADRTMQMTQVQREKTTSPRQHALRGPSLSRGLSRRPALPDTALLSFPMGIKPAKMEELTEGITAAEFHPHQCNVFVYSSSKGTTWLHDMRSSALCNRHSKFFEEPADPSKDPFGGTLKRSGCCVSPDETTVEKKGRETRRQLEAPDSLILLVTFTLLLCKNVASLSTCSARDGCWENFRELFYSANMLSEIMQQSSSDLLHEFDTQYSQSPFLSTSATSQCHTASLATASLPSTAAQEQPQQAQVSRLLDPHSNQAGTGFVMWWAQRSSVMFGNNSRNGESKGGRGAAPAEALHLAARLLRSWDDPLFHLVSEAHLLLALHLLLRS
ncbi:Serine/threonine-protein phosphatase 2A 55 kDa regulatory subunit B delta isoform [Fukomys damarensis]|uniref:Serine/threonine-protein phosphatase 2A 55 kDa regulatory subunit B delta isoform n=1 Tax=Fukomys damarensis TaxID=885580 RepID=A0A091DAX1_FUKDA|nr:Serine/threonine-protein phosphatase 2A 55 kDa regulatory subunit B delta isoform [Fukomys damarensis]